MKISVLTPSYNSGKYIERAIQSVLQQNYSNYEHIIVDGCSKDNTKEILKKFPHLKWISEKDQGQSDAMNKAFQMSTGEIIVYLNADDYFLPEAFMSVIEGFKKNNNADIIIGNMFLIINGIKKPSYPSEDIKDILKFWTYSFPLNALSYFYKRSIQTKTGLFPEKNHYTMDYWFLLRAYDIGKILKIENFLGVFEMHDESKSNKVSGLEMLKEETIQYLKEKKKNTRIIQIKLMYILFKVKIKMRHLKKIL
jgi:glycosyltransferase involved in cell wall biosynthesis